MYYTTYGEKQGQCGHAHRSVDLARACLVVKAPLFASFDRRVVAIDSTGLLAEIDEAGFPTRGVKLPGLGLGTVVSQATLPGDWLDEPRVPTAMWVNEVGGESRLQRVTTVEVGPETWADHLRATGLANVLPPDDEEVEMYGAELVQADRAGHTIARALRDAKKREEEDKAQVAALLAERDELLETLTAIRAEVQGHRQEQRAGRATDRHCAKVLSNICDIVELGRERSFAERTFGM